MPSTNDLSLINLDWRGCGEAAVREGVEHIRERLFDDARFHRIDPWNGEARHARADASTLDAIAATTVRTLEDVRARAPARIFHIGATCGTEVAPVAYLNERYAADLAVVWLDAHADLNTPASSPSGRFHGMVLRTLTGEGPPTIVEALPRPLEPRQIFLAGARDLDPPELEYVATAHVSLTTVEELNTPATLCERIAAAGFTRAYVHLDLDVLDPDAFPDALVRTPRGAPAAVVAAQIRAIDRRFDVVGFSVVEFVPRSAGGLEAVAALLAQTGIRIGAMPQLRPAY